MVQQEIKKKFEVRSVKEFKKKKAKDFKRTKSKKLVRIYHIQDRSITICMLS